MLWLNSDFGETVNIDKVLIIEKENREGKYLMRLRTLHVDSLFCYEKESDREAQIDEILATGKWVPFNDRFYLREEEVEAILETGRLFTVFIGGRKFEIQKISGISDSEISAWNLGV